MNDQKSAAVEQEAKVAKNNNTNGETTVSKPFLVLEYDPETGVTNCRGGMNFPEEKLLNALAMAQFSLLQGQFLRTVQTKMQQVQRGLVGPDGLPVRQ